MNSSECESLGSESNKPINKKINSEPIKLLFPFQKINRKCEVMSKGTTDNKIRHRILISDNQWMAHSEEENEEEIQTNLNIRII